MRQKTRLFISYSRKDAAFVDRLEAALKELGFETLIDRAEIYAFEDWWRRLQDLIIKADTLVFVVSPDSIASDVCQKEIDFACSLNKRIAPIVYRHADVAAMPADLARFNFIYLDDETRFHSGLAYLSDALVSNIDWIRKHTDISEQA